MDLATRRGDVPENTRRVQNPECVQGHIRVQYVGKPPRSENKKDKRNYLHKAWR